MNRRDWARKAVVSALRVRCAAGYKPWQPVPVIDLAEQLGVEVRFVDIPSLEGMYWKKSQPVVLIAAERPAGRQNFTCAHELGHHVFQHGNRIDEAFGVSAARTSEEYMADVFASILLMPKTAVLHAFHKRGQRPGSATPMQIFAVAGWLGVGYTTLIHHLHLGLDVLPTGEYRALLKVQPKELKQDIIGSNLDGEVVLVDESWVGARAVDVQVGDYVVCPLGTRVDGLALSTAQERDRTVQFRAAHPGISRIERGRTGWAAFVRVSRRYFVGRSIFRHLEEVSDD